MPGIPLVQHYQELHKPVGFQKENSGKGDLRPVIPMANIPIHPGMDFTFPFFLMPEPI